MATTMTFNNAELTTQVAGAIITNISRPVRPPYERNKVIIPGKDGSYDFGNNRREDFLVTVELVIPANSATELRTKLASLSTFLEGKHTLSFSDDSSTSYQAQVYDEVTAAGDATARWARVLVVFECDAGS